MVGGGGEFEPPLDPPLKIGRINMITNLSKIKTTESSASL